MDSGNEVYNSSEDKACSFTILFHRIENMDSENEVYNSSED